MAELLKKHVHVLAEEIGERNMQRYPELQQAAGYIARQLSSFGYTVNDQLYQVEGRPVRNLEVELKGKSRADEIVVVGAHYDSVTGSPGANDNASGVAAVLEVARALRGEITERTVRLVAFVNEEPPYFQTELMGSVVYARRAKARGEKVVAVYSLETIGYYSELPGSQHYPPPLSLFFPSKGDFIAFVADAGSGELVRRTIKTFRETTRFPSEAVAAPEFITGIGWSDQWAFWQSGYPGIMITDTAPFRYAHYHQASDTPDKLDYERMARVTAGLVRVVEREANR